MHRAWVRQVLGAEPSQPRVMEHGEQTAHFRRSRVPPLASKGSLKGGGVGREEGARIGTNPPLPGRAKGDLRDHSGSDVQVSGTDGNESRRPPDSLSRSDDGLGGQPSAAASGAQIPQL